MKSSTIPIKALLAGILAFTTIMFNFTGDSALAARTGGSARTPTVTVTALSDSEAAILTYMREEEKLARDIYLAMYDRWSAVVFSNIAVSEQQHMDTMKKMLDKYSLPDPSLDVPGLFTNSDLQSKYNQLLDSGSQSYVDGLYVGATIEEIDMVDIQHAIDITTHLDVITAYQSLLEGSKNHLRAYVKALDSQGVTYAPQFISQELYDAIIGL